MWFILHCRDQQARIERDEAVRTLGTLIPGGYSKGKCIYTKISINMDQAITRAEALERRHTSNTTPMVSQESNPSTQVHKLVKFIKVTIENNKRL